MRCGAKRLASAGSVFVCAAPAASSAVDMCLCKRRSNHPARSSPSSRWSFVWKRLAHPAAQPARCLHSRGGRAAVSAKGGSGHASGGRRRWRQRQQLAHPISRTLPFRRPSVSGESNWQLCASHQRNRSAQSKSAFIVCCVADWCNGEGRFDQGRALKVCRPGAAADLPPPPLLSGQARPVLIHLRGYQRCCVHSINLMNGRRQMEWRQAPASREGVRLQCTAPTLASAAVLRPYPVFRVQLGLRYYICSQCRRACILITLLAQ